MSWGLITAQFSAEHTSMLPVPLTYFLPKKGHTYLGEVNRGKGGWGNAGLGVASTQAALSEAS